MLAHTMVPAKLRGGERCQRQGERDDGQSHGAGILLILGNGEKSLAQNDRHHEHHGGQGCDNHQVRRAGGQDRPEEVAGEVGGGGRRSRDQDHAQSDPSVEHHGQGNIRAGAAADPDHLDGDGGKDGRDQRGPHGRLPGQDAHRDPGQGHVSQAVPDQGEPPLDEEDTHEGRGQTHEEGGEQGLAHEGQFEDLHQRCSFVDVVSGTGARIAGGESATASSGWW